MSLGTDFTDDGTFRLAAKQVLQALLAQVDDIDSDEHDPRLSDGNLAVSFESGGTFVLSQQPPCHELWLSANFTAWHFHRIEGTWVERDSGESMTNVLSGLFSDKLGMEIHFAI